MAGISSVGVSKNSQADGVVREGQHADGLRVPALGGAGINMHQVGDLLPGFPVQVLFRELYCRACR